MWYKEAIWHPTAEKEYLHEVKSELLEKACFSYQIAEKFTDLARPELLWIAGHQKNTLQNAEDQQLMAWACSKSPGTGRGRRPLQCTGHMGRGCKQVAPGWWRKSSYWGPGQGPWSTCCTGALNSMPRILWKGYHVQANPLRSYRDYPPLGLCWGSSPAGIFTLTPSPSSWASPAFAEIQLIIWPKNATYFF